MIGAADAWVRLGDLMDPVAGTLPTGILTTDAISTTRQTFTNQTVYSWSDNPLRFNNQGQKWLPDKRYWQFQMQTYGGVKNAGTVRGFTAPALGISFFIPSHVVEFEFIFTGQTLTFEFLNLGGDGTSKQWFSDAIAYGGDCQVLIEYGGRMWRAADVPKVTTRTDGSRSYRNISFTDPYHGRIRFRGANVGFMQMTTEASAIVAKAPDRLSGIADGDSYFESQVALDADNATGFCSAGIIDFISDMTGFVFARRGQGATGFFSNAAGFITDDTIGSVTSTGITSSGPSRFLSAQRRSWMLDAQSQMTALGQGDFVNYPGDDFNQPVGRKPLLYLLNGTWNDASVGGVNQATMYARAKDCYQWVHSVDPLCTFVHVSPEPFNDYFYGATIGDPRPGDISDIHRQGQMQAAAEVPRVQYVNAFGPDGLTRWWSGYGPDYANGSQGVPTDSQQAQLVSVHDGIHCRMEGYRYYASKIVDAIAEMRIPAVRANGLA